MERMRKKVRVRERRKMEVDYEFQRKRRRERDLIEKMAFVALNPLQLNFFRLLYSIRVSMDPRSREFLRFAFNGVIGAVQVVKSMGKFKDRMESKKIEALEGVISEATLELENVLDSHVSDQFVSQFESESIQLAGDERRPFLFSLNLQGIEQDIDGIMQTVMKMERLLNPWLQEEEERVGSKCKQKFFFYRVLSRSWFISLFATKAAQLFLGMKEDYIQELENLLPQQEDDDDYVIIFTRNRITDHFEIVTQDLMPEEEEEEEKDDYISRLELVQRFGKINVDLMIRWIDKQSCCFNLCNGDGHY